VRKITKIEGREPKKLTDWKRQNQHGKYTDLSDVERDAINELARIEQFGLCAYCCKVIDKNNSMNEHVEARRLAPHRSLDFDNIVASCTTPKRCDHAHGSQPLLLTPLMNECETDLKFYFSGKVEGLTDEARQSVEVLGLNSNAIREERKQMIANLLFPDTPDGVNFLEDDLIAVLIDDFQHPTDGQLQAYSPVLVNVLRQRVRINFTQKDDSR
jgi:uncharacterized protein (TIGR02646 family)